MRWLSEQSLAVTPDRFFDFLEGRADGLPQGAVLVTIDDGYGSVLTQAAPILARLRIPALAFVTTGLVGTRDSLSGENYLAWDEIPRLRDCGITIGSHACLHRSVGKLSLDEAEFEIGESKRLLEQKLGTPVETFAYPYGMRRDETPQTADILARHGYRCGFTSRHGAITTGTNAMRLPRVKVESGDSLGDFKAICDGGMDIWRVLDSSLWILQRPVICLTE